MSKSLWKVVLEEALMLSLPPLQSPSNCPDNILILGPLKHCITFLILLLPTSYPFICSWPRSNPLTPKHFLGIDISKHSMNEWIQVSICNALMIAFGTFKSTFLAPSLTFPFLSVLWKENFEQLTMRYKQGISIFNHHAFLTRFVRNEKKSYRCVSV